jgi:hypothetical protein
MITDNFIDVEAANEAEAELIVTAHIVAVPPSHEDSLINFITWETYPKGGE